MSQNIQPIFILPEDTQRSIGREAQRANIMAAKLVAETVRTTLGPKGMDKMIVDSMGDITITNDGATILDEMKIEHPTAKMIVEIAKTQEKEVGDGTTTAVVLAGELLKNAETLLDQEIHPAVLARGYRLASLKAQEILENMAETISKNNLTILKKIAETSMTGKGAESAKSHLSELCLKSVMSVTEEKDGKINVNKDNIKIEKRHGASIENTELVQGVIVDKERSHQGMPAKFSNPKILLLDSPIEIKKTQTSAKIKIRNPAEIQTFMDQEQGILKNMTQKIKESGANVVFCQKGVDDVAQYYLAKEGIYLAKRVKESDIKALSQATGAKIVTNVEEISKSDLGSAGVVEEVKVGDEAMTFVKDCKNPKAVTILVRGSTEHVVSEVVKAVEDSIGGISAALETGKVVAGAGAVEMELAMQLKKFSESLSGKEQLAVKAFADAMEVIPVTLAENAGLDPIDIITELRSAHDKKQKWAGIDVFTGKIMDAWNKGVIEPLKTKTQAVSSSSEVAIMILRIDDIVAGSKTRAPPMPPGMGGMGGMGMGGMPGMM